MTQAALETAVKNALDGAGGLSSPMATLASKVLLGTRLDELVTLQGSGVTEAAKVAALGAENTDGQLQIPLFAGVADGGTYTKAVTSAGLRTITRTAADAADSFWVEVPVPARTASGKGIKPTGVKLVYSVGTADAQDIRAELWTRVVPADGSAVAAPAVYGGSTDAEYDAAHNTAAERGDDTGAPEHHTMVMTVAAPAYLGDGVELLLRIFCDGAATSAIIIRDAVLLYSALHVDLS